MNELQIKYERELLTCEEKAARFGLTLSKEEQTLLAAGREQVLRDTGRVEFGGGILPQIIDAFCDSADIQQKDWADTLGILQEVFYQLKAQAGDLTPDRTILHLMRRVFDLNHDASFLEGFSIRELRGILKSANKMSIENQEKMQTPESG